MYMVQKIKITEHSGRTKDGSQQLVSPLKVGGPLPKVEIRIACIVHPSIFLERNNHNQLEKIQKKMVAGDTH